jgi:conjugal transfer pilus assembly protein TraD
VATRHPIENLLRYPAEEISALTFSAGAAVVLFGGDALYLTPGTSITGAGLLAGFAAMRFRQSQRLRRYQRSLRVLPSYSMSGDQVPYSRDFVFLGRGFRWDKRHTMRVLQLQEPEHVHLVRPTRLMKWAQRLDLKLEPKVMAADPRAKQIRSWLRSNSLWNPARPMPKVGGSPELHAVGLWEGESDQHMDAGERVGHMLVLGTTRVGKTRFAELLITQDIARGDVVIVFDPKGDADLMKRMYIEARRAGRLDEFYVFHLGRPDISARYNPIDSFDRITEVATRIANQLPGEGQSAAFKDFVWRFVNVMSRTMQSLGDRISYQELYRAAGAPGRLAIRYFETMLDQKHTGWRNEFEVPYATAQNKKEEGEIDDPLTADLRKAVSMARQTKQETRALALAAYLPHKEVTDDIATSLATMIVNDRTYFDKLVSSLYPLLEKLTTGRVAELISPDYNDPQDKRPIFTWADVVNRGGIVYVGLDSLSDYEVGGVVGNAMFADLTSLAGKGYKYGFEFGQSNSSNVKRKVCIHADEFNELIGDEFVPMVNKAGGAGYQVTVYTQTWADVEAKIGSKPKALQIAGNLNTLFMLRVKTEDTANMLIKQLPEISVPTKVLASSATDTNDPADFAEFGSKSEDRIQSERVPLLTVNNLTTLPKGQAFGLIEGGQLVKLRFPLPDSSTDGDVPDEIRDLAHTMRSIYKSKYLDLIGDADDDSEDWAQGGVDPLDLAIEQASSRS